MHNQLKKIETDANQLEKLFLSKLEVNIDLNRTLVSFQANKKIAEYRWFKYKEGFSASLLQYLFKKTGINKGVVFEPFAGIGTTLFVARNLGIHSVGIELLPIGCEIIQARMNFLNHDRKFILRRLQEWIKREPWKKTRKRFLLKHLRITEGAYSIQTEKKIGSYLATIEGEPPHIFKLLRLALLGCLEDISYTRKDGQYLRWDYRSGRSSDQSFNKGNIVPFDEAIKKKLNEIYVDLEAFPDDLFDQSPNELGNINIKCGSCLEIFPDFVTNSFNGLITSPPYCNRYDYTRTYALELALLGVDEEEIRRLRQTMLSCTVENREKENLSRHYSIDFLDEINRIFNSQKLLTNILSYLEDCKGQGLLNNNGIIRMIRNYFWEMTLWMYECARILKTNAPLVMVNDNVRYHGVNIPVDLILSDLAQKIGYSIEKIWVLPQGKGNSSQQMGNHGREELRKCIYFWRSPKAKPTNLRGRQLVLQHSDLQQK